MDEKNINQNPNNDIEIKPINKKEIEKKAKAKLKKKRPEYKKKRVIVPIISAVVLILIGIYLAVHATFFQSTDDAFVEGHIIQVAPKVAGQIIISTLTTTRKSKKIRLLQKLILKITRLNSIRLKLNWQKPKPSSA